MLIILCLLVYRGSYVCVHTHHADPGYWLTHYFSFLLAGHETTSTGTTWALYALTQAPEVQRKLREELLSVSTDTPSMDELMALPYLDMVVKEVLRLHTPVPSTVRIATKEEVIPVSEPFTDRNGEVQDKIT